MTPRPLLLTGLALAPCAAFAAFSVGGNAYTKRMETKLLATPSAVAQPVGTVAFGKKLQVKEIKGAWLRLKASKDEGWVFQGNVSDTEPKETAGIDLVPLSEESKNSTAAARPLAEGAVDYAERRGLGAAKADLLWMEGEAAKTGAAELRGYMEQEKKGEFQQ